VSKARGQEAAPAALLRAATQHVHARSTAGGAGRLERSSGPPYDVPIVRRRCEAGGAGLVSLACLAPARFQRLPRSPCDGDNKWPEHSSPFISCVRLRPRRQHSIPAKVVNRTRVTALGQHYSSRIHCRRYKCPPSPGARRQETRASVTATAPETAAACTSSVQITADDKYHQYRPLADWREPHPAEAQVGIVQHVLDDVFAASGMPCPARGEPACAPD
jgi:hypothetical protein